MMFLKTLKFDYDNLKQQPEFYILAGSLMLSFLLLIIVGVVFTYCMGMLHG